MDNPSPSPPIVYEKHPTFAAKQQESYFAASALQSEILAFCKDIHRNTDAVIVALYRLRRAKLEERQ